MPKFRKKPVVIEAFQVPPADEDFSEKMALFLREGGDAIDIDSGGVVIATLEGVMRGDPGDWIIKGVQGEFYPCKPDIFQQTYEPE
jgi:hypothetical protein